VLSDIGASAEATDLEISNASDNRIVTSSGGTDLNAEANFTFDGTNLDLTSTSTTADIFDVTGNSLTTGSFIHYAQSESGTTSVTNTGLVNIDFLSTGVLATGQTKSIVGQKTQLLSTGANHAASTFTLTGHDINLAFTSLDGSLENIGLDVSATGADTNTGILIKTTDGRGIDYKAISSADASDYFTISTVANGQTTMTTVESGVGSTAHLNFVVDGNITANSTNFDIGQSTDGVKITNSASSGGPALEIANNDVDEVALNFISPLNTTSHIINAASTTLTTGKLFNGQFVDIGTTSLDGIGMQFQYAKAGVTASGQTKSFKGFVSDVYDAATNHASGTQSLLAGEFKARFTTSNQGTTSTSGIEVTATGGDNNTGITTEVTDGGTDIKCLSSADNGDMFTIVTGTHGATTLTTIDDDATAAHFEIAADGNITLDAAGTIELEGNTTVTGSLAATTIDLHGAGVDGSANQLLTDDGDGTVTSETNATWNGQTFHLASTGGFYPDLVLENQENHASKCSTITLLKDKGAAAADADGVGLIQFKGDNAAQEETSYAAIHATIESAADTDEAGKLTFNVGTSDGTTSALQEGITLTGHSSSNIVNTTIGYGTGSTTTINGRLATGSSIVMSGSTTAASSIRFTEDTDNGSNTISLAGASSVDGNKTITMPDATGTMALNNKAMSFITCSFYDSLGTTLHYIPLGDSTSETTSEGNTLTDWIAPCETTVKCVIIRMSNITSSEDVTITVWKDPVGSGTKSSVEAETLTVDASGENDVHYWAFDSATIAKGEVMKISIQAASSMSSNTQFHAKVVLELNWDDQYTGSSQIFTS
jgi:hypothetical protein